MAAAPWTSAWAKVNVRKSSLGSARQSGLLPAMSMGGSCWRLNIWNDSTRKAPAPAKMMVKKSHGALEDEYSDAQKPATIATDKLTNAKRRLRQAKCRDLIPGGTRSPIHETH